MRRSVTAWGFGRWRMALCGAPCRCSAAFALALFAQHRFTLGFEACLDATGAFLLLFEGLFLPSALFFGFLLLLYHGQVGLEERLIDQHIDDPAERGNG